MDRVLVSPVWRGALNAGSVAYAVLTIVDPDGADRAAGARARRQLRRRRRRRAAADPRRGAARRGVRVALERRRGARAPARDADRRRQLRAAAAHVPLERADAAEPRAGLDPDVAKFNPVNWAVEAGRSAAMRKIDWGLVGSRIGLLVASCSCARHSPHAHLRNTSAHCDAQLSRLIARSRALSNHPRAEPRPRSPIPPSWW